MPLLTKVFDLFTAHLLLNQSEQPAPADSFDLKSCLDRVRSHDQVAAQELVDHFYPRVAGIVRRRSAAQVPAEDVIQDVFVRVFQKIEQYRGDVPFEHWISKIAVNTSLNQLRGKRLRIEVRRADLSDDEDAALDDITSSSTTPDPAHAVASNELLLKLLDRLKPEDRLAIELIELQGHTTAEAANMTNIRPAAMRARVSRARKKLKQYLEILLQEKTS